jgi:hypothetical protein
VLVVGWSFVFTERDVVGDEHEHDHIDDPTEHDHIDDPTEHDHIDDRDEQVDDRRSIERIPFVHGGARRQPASTARLEQQHASNE